MICAHSVHRQLFRTYFICFWLQLCGHCKFLIVNVRKNYWFTVFQSTRPAPSNQSDCFSPRFISKLRNFITVSYKNIQDNYINSNATCGYAELQSYYHQLEIETNKFVDIIIGPNPTYAAVDQAIVEYRKVVTPYTNAVRDYILANNKPCYFVVRKARNNPIAIGDWTITVAKKCVGYKDSSKLNC